jgi:hypothetical protein
MKNVNKFLVLDKYLDCINDAGHFIISKAKIKYGTVFYYLIVK